MERKSTYSSCLAQVCALSVAGSSPLLLIVLFKHREQEFVCLWRQEFSHSLAVNLLVQSGNKLYSSCVFPCLFSIFYHLTANPVAPT